MIFRRTPLYRLFIILLVVLSAISVFTVIVATAFVYRWMSVGVSVAYVRTYEIQPPPYNTTCKGVHFVAYLERYVNFSTGVPSDLLMVDGTRTPRGLIGVSGYWNNVSVGVFAGLRGFPITWQLREHKTYGAYNPDILFTSLSPEGIRLDSWTRGAGSLGNTYLFAILPVELVNNTVIRNRFDVNYTFSGRTVGFIDIANGTVSRFNDTYFATYNSWNPPWEVYRELYYRLYTVYIVVSGTTRFDIVNTTVLPATYGPYVTYSYVLADYWIAQQLYFDVYYILVSTLGNATLVNFTYPYMRYRIVMERTGTVNDYGYLDFGVPGFTASYFNTSLNASNVISTRLVSNSGAGMGGIALLDSTLRNMYVIGLNNTNGVLAVYRYLGANRTLLGSAPVPGFANNTVYNITVYYVREADVNRIVAYVYSATGVLLANVNVTDTAVTPVYPGLAVQSWLLTYTDFIFLDYKTEPWLVRVQPVPLYYHVEFYADGVLRARNTSTVHYGPVDLIIPYGVLVAGNNFVIKYPNEMACLNTTGITVYTGSLYNLTTGLLTYNLTARNFTADIGYGMNTSSFILLNISIAGEYEFYAYVSLNPYHPVNPGLYLEVYLVNSTGYWSSPIVVLNGVVVNPRTTPSILLRGGGNYIWVVARHANPGLQSTVKLNLFLCSTPIEAVCQIVEINVVLKS